jgi:hypothetical protein
MQRALKDGVLAAPSNSLVRSTIVLLLIVSGVYWGILGYGAKAMSSISEYGPLS